MTNQPQTQPTPTPKPKTPKPTPKPPNPNPKPSNPKTTKPQPKTTPPQPVTLCTKNTGTKNAPLCTKKYSFVHTFYSKKNKLYLNCTEK